MGVGVEESGRVGGKCGCLGCGLCKFEALRGCRLCGENDVTFSIQMREKPSSKRLSIS